MGHFDNERFLQMLTERAEPFSLRELAKETAVSFATLSRALSGSSPSLEVFFTLCAWMQVSPALFMRGSVPETCPTCDRLGRELRRLVQTLP